MEVRPASRGDLEGIQGVAEAAWAAAHEPIVGADAVASFLEDHYDAESFEAYLGEGRALLAVADDGGVVGFASASPDEDDPAVFHLGRLYVEPDRWGEGIGRRLLEHAETRAAERGAERLVLGVMAANERAVGFYEAAGFERVDGFRDERLETDGYTYAKEL